jgi:hypothetical protein
MQNKVTCPVKLVEVNIIHCLMSESSFKKLFVLAANHFVLSKTA